MSAMKTWSATGELCRGTTLIEASAGTGKTYNITSLVLRLVAEEDLRIERILVVTYTRAATAELKDRIRDRLVDAIEGLGREARPTDPVLETVWDVEPGLRAERVRRLRRALESFDRALISTIHGFCQRMLQLNAFESGVAFDLELTPNTDDLMEQIVDDFLTNTFYAVEEERFSFLKKTCGFTRGGLMVLAKRGLSDPDTTVCPPMDGVSEEAWPGLVEGLRADWPTLGEALIEHINSEVVAAKAGEASVFKRGQRTHNEKATRAWVEGVGAWLKSGPRIGSSPPMADRFDGRKIKAQLVDAEVIFEDPALERLNALLSFPKQVAGTLRARFVHELRTRFDQAKEELRIQTYQDLLRGLAGRLDEKADPVAKAALVEAIAKTFDAALIDEFQDTDHHQWTLFKEVFGQGGHHLYLIGDPKQAIYGFRGANVHVYSQATEDAGERRFTMSTNWRSDRGLLRGLNHLLDQPGSFGPSVSFGYVPVDAPPSKGADGLRNAPGAPVELRWFDSALVGGDDPEAMLAKGALAGVLEARVAEDVVELLSGATEITDGEDTWRKVKPGDVAVLVRKGRQAAAIQLALRRAGVPAVLSGAASVLASEEALELQHWLEALASTSGMTASRVAASTHLFGWTAAELIAVEAEEAEAMARWEMWLGRLARWRVTLQRRGFMAAFRSAVEEEGVRERLLRLQDGERRVTNLLHAAELVHRAASRERLHLSALLSWLKSRRSLEDLDPTEVELRLDQDAEAVSILTIHKSKGLEFPVCFVPYLWDGGMTIPHPDTPLVIPDPNRRTRRLLDVGVPTLEEHQDLATLEAMEEALRLSYVALTRAKHRVVVYSGLVKGLEMSPMAAVLHGSGPDRLESGAIRVEQGPEALRSDLETIAQSSLVDGRFGVSVRDCEPPLGKLWRGEKEDEPRLSSRVFRRRVIDPGWRRHSYTSVTREAGRPRLVEDGREGFDADATDRSLVPVVEERGEMEEVPLAGFPSGPEAGTFLHAVFEFADFADCEASGEERLRGVIGRLLVEHGFEVERYQELLVTGLQRVLRTPLGGPLGELALRDIGRKERLDELRFDLPILGGTHFEARMDACSPTRGLVEALRSRGDGRLPEDWLRSLDRLDRVRLAGFLTGSIDLVFRAEQVDGERRWFVVDYKSNRIDPQRSGRCVAAGFRPESMTAEMARHDYFLQYHLYLVALHRYLRWRIIDYDYDTHIGGVYYLFFRGMVGEATERQGSGAEVEVFGSWFDRPRREVIEALDRALEQVVDGGEG